MHGRMHSNYCQITILLVVDLCSSLAYFMMTQLLPIAGKLPIKTFVAKQLHVPTSPCVTVCSAVSIQVIVGHRLATKVFIDKLPAIREVWVIIG